MTTDGLKAWLLLAGFSNVWRVSKNKYIYSRYGEYIIVEFLFSGRVEVATLDRRRHFLFSKQAQQYIQELMEK